MSTEEIDHLVLAAMRPTGSEFVSLRWVEIRIWANYPTDSELRRAPDTFDIRDSTLRLVEAGLVERNTTYGYRLTEASGAQLDRLRERIRDLESFARDIRDGYDHDEDAHRYGTRCRKCEAEVILDCETQLP